MFLPIYRSRCAVTLAFALVAMLGVTAPTLGTSPGASLIRCLDEDEPRCWIGADAGIWWLEGYHTPELLTASPQGTAGSAVGVLGQPTTTTMLGDHRMGGGDRFGGRIRMGRWLDRWRTWGAELEYLAVASDGGDSVYSSAGDPILTRPFFNTNPNVFGQDSQIVGMAGLASGVLATTSSGRVLTVAPSLRRDLCGNQFCVHNRLYSRRADILVGYRYLRLAEDFSTDEVLSPIGPQYAVGTTIQLHDSFRAVNEFHGGEVGMDVLNQYGKWLWGWTAKVAMGQVRSHWTVDGYTTGSIPNAASSTLPGGFYTTQPDQGSFSENSFAVLPQIRLTSGYTFDQHWDFRFSYDFLYLSSAVRPGDLFDANIDGRTLAGGTAAGPPDPNPIGCSGMWLQGISLGLTYRY